LKIVLVNMNYRIDVSLSFKMLVHNATSYCNFVKNKCRFLTILLQQKIALVMSF